MSDKDKVDQLQEELLRTQVWESPWGPGPSPQAGAKLGLGLGRGRGSGVWVANGIHTIHLTFIFAQLMLKVVTCLVSTGSVHLWILSC